MATRPLALISRSFAKFSAANPVKNKFSNCAENQELLPNFGKLEDDLQNCSIQAKLDHPAPSTITSAYIHLPFCRKRCHYCDFPIVALGTNTQREVSLNKMERYVDFLCREIEMTSKHIRQDKFSAGSLPTLRTVFFGGGTPSLISGQLLHRVISVLNDSFGIEAGAEISMEMDPGTFDGVKLASFLDCGVNRVSLGVQAFHDDILKNCGRSHNLNDAEKAVQLIQSIGIKNWSMDLISSLPGQTLSIWEESLTKAISLCPAHVSVYDLQIEEGTAFGRWFRPGESPLPSSSTSADMYRMASSLLQSAGYSHYEISNYALAGHECSHNLVYWRNQGYFAFGLGSTSFVSGQRFSRPRSMSGYELFVEGVERQGFDSQPAVEAKEESNRDEFLDTVMLGLRLSEGLKRADIEGRFGAFRWMQLVGALGEFVTGGLVSMEDECGSSVSGNGGDFGAVCLVKLTSPDGFLFSNEIISRVFQRADET